MRAFEKSGPKGDKIILKRNTLNNNTISKLCLPVIKYTISPLKNSEMVTKRKEIVKKLKDIFLSNCTN